MQMQKRFIVVLTTLALLGNFGCVRGADQSLRGAKLPLSVKCQVSCCCCACLWWACSSRARETFRASENVSRPDFMAQVSTVDFHARSSGTQSNIRSLRSASILRAHHPKLANCLDSCYPQSTTTIRPGQHGRGRRGSLAPANIVVLPAPVVVHEEKSVLTMAATLDAPVPLTTRTSAGSIDSDGGILPLGSQLLAIGTPMNVSPLSSPVSGPAAPTGSAVRYVTSDRLPTVI